MTATIVDLSFPVRGYKLPCDHSYALYGALSRAIPDIHNADWIGIHGIGGTRVGPEMLSLESRGVLRLRVPAEKVPMLLTLIGMTIDVAGSAVEIGTPTVRPLVPAAILDARLVVIRLTGGVPKPFDRAVFEQRFIAEAQRQLVELGVKADIELCGRGSLRVGGQRVIGYAMRAHGLSAEDSLKLQAAGIGGKRTMGCGLFRPARLRLAVKQVA